MDFRQLTLDAGPLIEPVSLTEIKDHLRIDGTDSDTLLVAMIRAAREHVERRLNISLVERTYTAKLQCFAEEIELPRGPVTSIEAIKYYNADSPSVLTTLLDNTTSPVESSEVVRLNEADNAVYRVSGQTFPATALRHDAVQITYKAGAEATGSPLTADVSDSLVAAIKLIVGDLYENRESSTPLKITQLPTVERLLELHRVYQ